MLDDPRLDLSSSAIVVVLAFLVAGCAVRPLQVAVVATAAADLHSTHLAVSREHGREANPFMDTSTTGQILRKAAATTLVLWASEALRDEHEGLAKALLGTAAVIWGAVAARNYAIAWGAAR